MDCFLCLPVQGLGIRSWSEGGSSQKVVVLCKAEQGIFQSQWFCFYEKNVIEPAWVQVPEVLNTDEVKRILGDICSGIVFVYCCPCIFS